MDEGATPPGGEELPEMGVVELKERMDAGDPPVLVDVREPFERRIADLPDVGQRRIPVGELEARLDELDAGDELVLYCRTGARSAWATELLLARGFERARNLRGGLFQWQSDVDPDLTAY